MLTNADFAENTESQYILSVAPGEGNKCLSIFRDQYSEELAYPGTFLGHKSPENKDRPVSVYYSDICKSEVRQSDRRAAMCVENIFFKTKNSAVGANSTELRDKILKQIPSDPRKTKQLASNLQLAEGERTEVAINIRTDDGMTNGAGNVMKKVKIQNRNSSFEQCNDFPNITLPNPLPSTKKNRLEISN